MTDGKSRVRFFHVQISTLDDWMVTDVNASRAVAPTLDVDNGWLTVAAFEVEYDSPFWLAPRVYTGNRLSSYGSNLTYSVTWVVMRGDTSGKPTTEPNVILVVNMPFRVSRLLRASSSRANEQTVLLLSRFIASSAVERTHVCAVYVPGTFVA